MEDFSSSFVEKLVKNGKLKRSIVATKLTNDTSARGNVSIVLE